MVYPQPKVIFLQFRAVFPQNLRVSPPVFHTWKFKLISFSKIILVTLLFLRWRGGAVFLEEALFCMTSCG